MSWEDAGADLDSDVGSLDSFFSRSSASSLSFASLGLDSALAGAAPFDAAAHRGGAKFAAATEASECSRSTLAEPDGADWADGGGAGHAPSLPFFWPPPRRCRVRGYSFDYVDAVPPRPVATLLLLGSFPEGPLGFRRLLPLLLTRGFRLIIPSLRGYNAGDPQPKQAEVAERVAFYSLRSIAEDLAGLLGQLGLQSVVAMGYNGGCHALFSLCLLFPSLVSHAVFLSTPYIPPAQVYVPDALFAMRANPAMAHRLYMQTDRAVRDIDANLALLLHAFLRPGGAEEAAKTARMSAEITAGREDAMAALSAGFGTASPLLSDAETEALVAHIRSIGGIGGPIQWYRLESGTVENFKDVPREIHVPVLFVGAEFQPLSAEAQRVRMRQLCPDLAEVVLQGAGSWIALERPEEVADIVGSWLYSRS